ncbi:MAG: LysR family transcriptional regulator [Hornefia sp.]|nr:LysR family transcriptional regulator [Hornefia sp.]
MDNRKYEALINIAETGSITNAAERMGYTQSGITQMINSLEKELGVKLLTRTNKGAILTPNGQELLPLMREEFRWERTIQQECARMTGKETGSVTVGCLSSISTAWMPGILETFAKEYPNIKVKMIEHEAPGLERMLLNGRIDMAIMEVDENKTYVSKVLLKDEIFAVLPQHHELAGEKKIALENLIKYPFISYATGDTSSIQGWPENRIPQAKLNVMYTCKNDLTAIQMVKHNLGVSLAGKLMLSSYEAETVNISLDPPMYRFLGVATRAGEKALPATQSFINTVVEIIGKSTEK